MKKSKKERAREIAINNELQQKGVEVLFNEVMTGGLPIDTSLIRNSVLKQFRQPTVREREYARLRMEFLIKAAKFK